MITNSELTVYHKTLNTQTRLEKWTRYNYSKVWWFGGKDAGIDKGYENANDVEIRLPYKENSNISTTNFAIGDILIKGNIDLEISTQQDLANYEIYNITSIKDNTLGNNPHVHIGGK